MHSTEPEEAKVDHDELSPIDPFELTPSPENDTLYKPIRYTDPAIMDLSKNVRQYGLQEPIVATAYGCIVGEHCRYAAADIAIDRQGLLLAIGGVE